MIDAQWKFAVTSGLVKFGEPRTDDPVLSRMHSTAYYPLGASLAGAPLAALGFHVDPASPELAHFLWTLTTALIAALIPVTLFQAWIRQGFAASTSVGWALLAAFGTLLWPTATSSFDQAQHAWLLLLAVLIVDKAVATENPLLAVAAGATFSAVLHYQPSYVVLWVPICAVITPWAQPSSLFRRFTYAACFSVGSLPGLMAELWFNYYRFGSILTFVPPSNAPTFGNPLVGMSVLLFSQGKGIVFFTPLLLIAAAGFRGMSKAQPRLAVLVASVSFGHLVFVSSLAFPGGDWCWGPRYLVVTLPLVCLMLPYGAKTLSRSIIIPIVATSVVVQVLGLSIDHHRFYYERNLPAHFWARDPLFHFRESQLIARPGEVMDPMAPKTFSRFSSGPSEYLTYCPFGPPAALTSRSSIWMRQFAVFYLPRPWPLWMSRIHPERRFIALGPAVGFLSSMAFAGLLTISLGIRQPRKKT